MSSFQKCCICDGKLVNGRCVECGMRMTNESRETNLNTRQRAEVTEKSERYEDKKWIDNQAQKTGKELHPYNSQKNKVDKKKNLNVIKIASILVVVIAILVEAVQGYNFGKHEVIEDLGAWFTEESVVEEERDPYEFATRELAAEGELYENSLGTGFYEVGVQIPEGQYTLTAESNCNISLNIRDSENHINIWESFSDIDSEYRVDELTDVRLYAGAKVWLMGSGSLLLVSENGQTQSMAEMIENPMKEVVTVKTDGSKSYVAGRDFPEGIYDICSGQGNMEVSIYEESEDKSGRYFTVGTDYGTTSICNVEFSVGDDLNISAFQKGEEAVLELVPSSVVPAPIKNDTEDTV